MKDFTRRTFLAAGTGGVVGLAVSDSIPRTLLLGNRTQVPRLEQAFLIEPTAISRIDSQTKKLSHLSAWSLSPESRKLIPLLVSPASADVNKLRAWSDGSLKVEDGSRNGTYRKDSIDALMNAVVNGIPDVSDLVAACVSSLEAWRELDLGVEFWHSPDSDALANKYRVSDSFELPVTELVYPLQFRNASLNAVSAMPALDLFGWRIQFRTGAPHSLGSCVRQQVKHFHVDVQRAVPGRPGRFENKAVFHLGTYRENNRKCIVLWQNEGPKIIQVCWKICTPNKNDLSGMFKWMLTAVAAIDRIRVETWQLVLMGETLAILMLLPLLVLV